MRATALPKVAVRFQGSRGEALKSLQPARGNARACEQGARLRRADSFERHASETGAARVPSVQI